MVKKFIFIQFLVGFVFIQNVSSQNDKTTQDDHFEMMTVVGSWPELRANEGFKGLENFIEENVRQVNIPEGLNVVRIRFYVDTLGNTSNHIITLSVNPELDNEALRICRLMKFETPALQFDKPIAITWSLSFNFKKILSDKQKAAERERKKRK